MNSSAAPPVPRLKRAAEAAREQVRTPEDPRPVEFRDVLDAELGDDEIGQRRQRLYVEDPAPRHSLVGLALSGGGTRSATFSLGVLQGMHQLGLLRLFDYLSTVSGGGFAGGWWSAWLARDDFDRFEYLDVLEPVEVARKLRDAELLEADSQVARQLEVVDAIDRARHAGSHRRRWIWSARLWRNDGRGAAVARLHESLVEELNELVDSPEPLFRVKHLESWLQDLGQSVDKDVARRKVNAYLLWLVGQPELGRPLFPPGERVEPERAERYVDERVSESAMAAGDDPIHHLRLFSNYITPRKGLFSPDTWRAAMVVSRNLILTWAVLVPVIVALMMLTQLYFIAQPFNDAVVTNTSAYAPRGVIGASLATPWERAAVAARPVAVILLLLAITTALWMVFNDAGVWATRLCAGAAAVAIAVCAVRMAWRSTGGAWWSAAWQLVADHRYDAILLGVTLAIGLGLIARAYSVRVSRDTVNPYRMEVTRPLGSGPRQQVRANWTTARQTTLLAWLATVTATLLLAGCAHGLVAWLLADVRVHGLGTIRQAIAAAVAGATAFGSIFTAIKASPTGGHDARDVGQPGAASQLVFALTPPLVLVVVGVMASWASLECLRWVLADFEHRVGPLTIAALVGVSLCVVFAAYEFHDDLPADGGSQAPRWLALGLLAVVAYVVVWFLPLELAWVVGHAGSAWAGTWVRALLAATVALVFIATTLHRTRWRVVSLAGFALGVLCSLYVIGRGWPDTLIALSPAGLRSDPLYAGWCLFATLGALVVTLGWMADPNALSMHTFYKTRLVRGYLGASNSQRRRELRDITETATGDDIHLQDLATSRAGGPYHLINTTLNLVGGRDLTTAQRSAVNFVLTRRFCGSVRTGYRDTRWYMGGELTLGAAIAASGAAVSPAMGSRTPTAALTMLLAFLNVRLGLWVPAPHKAYWRSPQTRLWPFYLLRESLSQANDVIAYCYLTDGGHFDNTGLHALVERACRFIVLVDNGADPEPCFEDVGQAIRRCRIDFGAEIDLPINSFRQVESYQIELGPGPDGSVRQNDRRIVRAHYAVGTITYAPPHLEALGWGAQPVDEVSGVIVWIKPTIVARDPTDVRQYGYQNAAFPQQSTIDQWFDESQFESYRKLGERCALEAFGKLAATERLGKKSRITAADVRGLFEEVLTQWSHAMEPRH